MFLGKVGAMALYAKKRNDFKKKLPHQYLIDHQEKFQQQLKKKNIYTVTQYPKGAWFLGILFLVSGISLLYILLTYDKGDLTVWWRYLIIIGMTILGIVFLFNADKMKYEIHKSYQILLIEKMNPFLLCRKITIIKDLELLNDIRIAKKGHKQAEYYTIQFLFKDDKVDTLEYNDLREVKLKFTEITTFLNQQKDLGKIKIEQEQDPLLEMEKKVKDQFEQYQKYNTQNQQIQITEEKDTQKLL